MAGHQQLHEAAGRLVAVLALDDHFADIAVIKVADRALDEVAVAIDERRCAALQRALADLVPEAGEIVEVALDLGLGARKAGGADDQAHGLGQVEVRHDRLQPLAVGAVRNLPADAAAVRRVRHQHAVAAGEAEIGRQSRALVAALFLDDLDEQHLAALDHVLDLVAAAEVLALLAKLVGGGFVDRRAVRAGAGFLSAVALAAVLFAFVGSTSTALGSNVLALVVVVLRDCAAALPRRRARLPRVAGLRGRPSGSGSSRGGFR